MTNQMNKPLTTVASFIDKTSSPEKVYNFPFNIDSLNWSYQVNTQSYDTIGGRVTQMLSARATMMSLQGQAGNRENVVNLYETFKKLQDTQNTTKSSMTLSVPSQNLLFNVWLEQMQIGWDITTITYPYSMSFELDQDLSNASVSALTSAAMSTALNKIAGGIGFNPVWLGLSTLDLNLQFSDIKTFINQFQTQQ